MRTEVTWCRVDLVHRQMVRDGQGRSQRLRTLGWAEGQNLVIEHRFTGGNANLLPALAEELVRLKVEIIGALCGTPLCIAGRGVRNSRHKYGTGLKKRRARHRQALDCLVAGVRNLNYLRIR